MAKLIELNLDPDERTLRQFGWIALVGFAFLAGIAWNDWLIFAFGLGAWKQPVVAGLLGFGLLSALLGLVFPRANKPLFVGLSLAAFPIGFVVSHVIMATLYFAIITPMGLLMRLLGKDPLERKLVPEADSYWVDARPQRPREAYFKQF